MEALSDSGAQLGPRLRRFIGRRVRDPHAADDIAQDVMLKLAAQRGAPAADRLARWAFGVARNAITDHYRARGRSPVVSTAGIEQLANDAAPAREGAVRELAPCLPTLVDQLAKPDREVIRLADLDGLTQQAVADRLGISLSGAKSRVQRARGRLRDMILDCCAISFDARGGVMDVDTTERTARYCGRGPVDAGCGN